MATRRSCSALNEAEAEAATAARSAQGDSGGSAQPVNAERLLRLFDRVADVRDSVDRLRALILRAALRGKLVNQRELGGRRSTSLNAVRQSLAGAANETGRLRWRNSEPVDESWVGGPLPNGWQLARLNDTGLYVNGLAFKPSDWHTSGVPIIRIQNLTDESKAFNYARGTFPDEVLVRPGDILVSWSATLDAFVWKRGVGVLNQHIFRVIPATELVSSAFLYVLLRGAIRDLAESQHAHGLVMAHVNWGPFLNHVVAVPPMEEQSRIVAKLDELMALCDQLENAKRKSLSASVVFTAATLAGLADHHEMSGRDRRAASLAIRATARLTERKD